MGGEKGEAICSFKQKVYGKITGLKIILCYRRVANLLLVIIMTIRSTLSPSKNFPHINVYPLPNKADFIGLGNLISGVAHSLTTSGSVEEGQVHVRLGKGDKNIQTACQAQGLLMFCYFGPSCFMERCFRRDIIAITVTIKSNFHVGPSSGIGLTMAVSLNPHTNALTALDSNNAV